jgi:hypothetical protein
LIAAAKTKTVEDIAKDSLKRAESCSTITELIARTKNRKVNIYFSILFLINLRIVSHRNIQTSDPTAA